MYSGDGFDQDGKILPEQETDLEALTQKIAQALSKASPELERSVALGIEARSILKSIETETLKLQQFDLLSRTDRHYFRARFNYYKLSILRLRTEERDFLEPRLVEFHQEICQREFESGSDPSDHKHTPFLEAVRTPASSLNIERKSFPLHTTSTSSSAASVSSASLPPAASEEWAPQCLADLKLIRMALDAPPSAQGQRTIGQSIDRIIEKLEARAIK